MPIRQDFTTSVGQLFVAQVFRFGDLSLGPLSQSFVAQVIRNNSVSISGPFPLVPLVIPTTDYITNTYSPYQDFSTAINRYSDFYCNAIY